MRTLAIVEPEQVAQQIRIACALVFFNVGGWSLKDPENSNFRQTVINSLSCDIFGVNETFFRHNEYVTVEGYTFYAHNRKNLHRSAKRGSGGVGVFVKNELCETYAVFVLDNSYDDILWIKLSSKRTMKILSYVCVICRRQNPCD